MGAFRFRGIILFCIVFLALAQVSVLVTGTEVANITLQAAVAVPPVNETNSSVDYFSYDRANSSLNGTFYNISYGTNTYFDYSIGNMNAILNICHPQLEVGQKVDLVYASENLTLFYNLVRIPPQITSLTSGLNGTTNCTSINIATSSTQAFYPGFIYPVVQGTNSSIDYSNLNFSDNSSGNYLLPQIAQPFNGSYTIGVGVVGPPKTYLFSVTEVYDQNGYTIDSNYDALIMSFLNTSNTSLAEDILRPAQSLSFTGNLDGGETIHVNDIQSLELKIYNPCDPLNESGYYLVNNSVFNQNETCVVINDTENAVLNFVGELIDGDDSENGSKANDTCAVEISDSRNITLENFRAQQYYYGLCIFNSSVAVFGTATSDNTNGIYIDDNSTVNLVQLSLESNESEIIAQNSSDVELFEVNFTTALVNAEFTDATFKAVPTPPEPPNITNITDIEQYIEITNNSNESILTLRFNYPIPLPNNISPSNISIFKYNGSFGNFTTSSFDNTTNVTTYTNQTGWYDGEWEIIFTLISPSEQLIIAPTITNFSVFAPFGFEVETSETEVPEPEPDPDPDPESGASAGSGGTPSPAEQDPEATLTEEGSTVELVLELPDNITVQQGEAYDVDFNVTNVGVGTVGELRVGPLPPFGWDYTNGTIPGLLAGEKLPGNFQIAPYEQVIPGRYLIPTSIYIAEENYSRVITEVLEVIVLPRGTDLRRIRILEYPPEVTVAPFSQRNISFFARNIGDYDLANITVKVDPSECVLDIQGLQEIERGASDTLTYTFFFGEEAECDYNVKFYQNDEIVGFVPMSITVEPLAFTAAEIAQLSIIIIVLALWTLLTMRVLRMRARRIYKEEVTDEDEEEGFYY